VKKFAGFGFSKHATCAYLPSLSTCLGSPLVSFLQILQVLSTHPSSTYSPSTVFVTNLVGQYSLFSNLIFILLFRKEKLAIQACSFDIYIALDSLSSAAVFM
jgi:hypothetical protein